MLLLDHTDSDPGKRDALLDEFIAR